MQIITSRLDRWNGCACPLMPHALHAARMAAQERTLSVAMELHDP